PSRLVLRARRPAISNRPSAYRHSLLCYRQSPSKRIAMRRAKAREIRASSNFLFHFAKRETSTVPGPRPARRWLCESSTAQCRPGHSSRHHRRHSTFRRHRRRHHHHTWPRTIEQKRERGAERRLIERFVFSWRQSIPASQCGFELSNLVTERGD